MTKIPAWQQIKAGDEVTIVAPSLSRGHRLPPSEIEKIAAKFSQWGLKLTMPKGFGGPDYYVWIDKPEDRAQQVIDALKDEKIKVMFVLGGNSAEDVIEILRRRSGELKSRNDMVAVGFSDGDQMLHFLGAELGVVTPVEGPAPGRFITNESEATAMKDFLFDQKTEKSVLTCLNDAARRAGKFDGRLEVFDAMNRRSSYRPIVDEKYGSILLLEAAQGGKNSGNSLAFALEVMRRQGEKPRAIVLSEVDAVNLAEVIAVATHCDIPIFIGAPFGHGLRSRFLPLPLHTDSKIVVNGDGAELLVDAVRSIENIEVVKGICRDRPRYSAGEVQRCSAILEITEPVMLTATNAKWVDRVASEAIAEEFLLSRAVSIRKIHEACGLDGIDLAGKNLMVELPTLPPSEVLASIQIAGEVLMELRKSGELPTTIAFVCGQELPREFSQWLQDFAGRNCPNQKFFTGKTPEFFREAFSRGHAKAESAMVPRVSVKLQSAQARDLDSAASSVGRS